MVEVFDAVVGDLVADRASREDLERVEVEVDRVRVLGEVDEPPDLVLAEHREEGRGVLEVGGDGAVAGGLLAFGDGDERSGVVVGGDRELAHGEHVGLAVELPLDERDRAARRAGQRLRRAASGSRWRARAGSCGGSTGPWTTRKRMTCG